MIYIKVEGTLYPAKVSGKVADRDWDNRESKAISLVGDFTTVNTLFADGTAWSIVSEETVPVFDAEGNPVLDATGQQTHETRQTEFDNSELCIRGDLTVHVDGTCTVLMGKPTDLEDAYEILYGGVE